MSTITKGIPASIFFFTSWGLIIRLAARPEVGFEDTERTGVDPGGPEVTAEAGGDTV